VTARVAAALCATAGLTLVGTSCGAAGPPPTVAIRVGGSVESVNVGTTLGEAADALGLRPRSGDLLDVGGNVLHPHVFPGLLLLNGRRRPAATVLRKSDRIRVVDGRSRRERIVRRVTPVEGGLPPDPQFTLVRQPGVEVVVQGAVSHELVARRFHVTRGPEQVERAVALTFDDGPWPQSTPRVLAVLRRLHVRATFFVIGYLADAYPDLVRSERRAGMVVGNHTYNHPEVPPFDQLPRALVDDEIALGAASLGRAGVKPALFRPPAGSVSATVVRAAEAANERVVLWSVDPRDWEEGTTAREIKQRVLDAVQPGSIVELHDGGGDRSATIAALPGIVKGIRHRHLRLVTLTPR
jgi:peptidoglycan/xylan/chitin deacetylase (PgdA/CDA1 family)